MTQILIDSLIRAAELSFLAVGLTMVYSVLRFANFAHVEFATVGAYLTLAFSSTLGAPLLLAAGAAIILVGTLGVGIDRAIFSRPRATSPIMLMIISFALGIGLRETVRAIWGPSPFFFKLGVMAPWQVLGVRITPTQVAVIVAALVAMLAFHLLLSRTTLGIAMRATADNAPLAQASGIPTKSVVRAVWFIGAAFAALGGILIGLNTQVKPDMGLGLIIETFAAAIVGGIGSPYGAILGAALVGFAENVGLSINWSPVLSALGIDNSGYTYIPTGYKAVVAFSLLIITLLLRPQGLLGTRR
jgi:branched-subunit amino acid ABC-type transport system permease component